MLLQGTLQEYPLEDLLAILAEHKETGRLDFTFKASTAQLYLQEGRPVDCCLGNTQGVDALNELLSHNQGIFRFMSCLAPPNLNFRNGKEDHDLSSLLRERERQAKLARVMRAPAVKTREAQPPRPANDVATAAAPPPRAVTRYSNERSYKGIAAVMVLATIAGLIGLIIGAGISNSSTDAGTHVESASAIAAPPIAVATPDPGFIFDAVPTPVGETTKQGEKPAFEAQHPRAHTRVTEVSTERKDVDGAFEKKSNAKVVSIPVVLRIENGRVVEAYPAAHRPGWEAYEATAIRLARQRRFDNKTSTETLVLTITGN